MVHQDRITLQTTGHGHLQDITHRVAEIVRTSGIHTGTVHIFHVGSTAAVGTIEFEPGCSGTCPNYWID